MKFRAGIVFTVIVSCFDMGCAHYLDRGTSISSSVWMGKAFPIKGLYDDPPSVNNADFYPYGGSMSQHTWNPSAAEIDFSAEFRLLIPDYVYFGFVSTPLSLHNHYTSSCFFINCRQIRMTTVKWWDTVAAEDVILTRSPSIGVLVGFRSDEGKASKVIQYSFSGRYYSLGVGSFVGVDCINCQNSSTVKSTRTVASGMALRHTIDIGPEPVRLSFWFESISSKAWASGLGVTITGAILKDSVDGGKIKKSLR